VELLLGHFFQRDELVNAGVVDHDVDLPERFLRFSEQSLDFCLFRNVALDSDSFSAALTNFVYHAICVLLGRRIINDYGRALRCEFFRDARADSLRRSRYYCNFSIQFIAFHLVLSSSCDPCFPFKPNDALNFECVDTSATQRRRHVAALQSAQPSASS
jgi:hypothetical protein